MRILYITQHFQPEPIFFGLPLANELAQRGHDVEVLTGFPNYPGGRIYPGYKVRPLMRETMEGIPVNRVPLYPSHDNSSIKRMLCYTSFAMSASTIGAWTTKKADVAYVSQGPIMVGLPACVLKLLKGIPFVFHVQDLWPDSLLSTGMFNNKLGLKLVNGWCNFIYKRAAKIIVISPGIKQKLVERGVPEDKIEIIYNWCDDSQINLGETKPGLANELGMEGKFNIVFAGNMGKAQALESVLNAAKIIAVRNPNIQFVFIGGGVDVEHLKAQAAQLKLMNVIFLPRRPFNELCPILQLADVLFVHLRDDPLFRITIPSKTQGYLAAGKPILIGVRGDAADLVLRAQAGLACEPENIADIAATALKFAAMPASELKIMGKNGKQFYDRELSFAMAMSRLDSVFSSIVR